MKCSDLILIIHTQLYGLKSSSSSCRAASTDIPDPSRHYSLSFIASGKSSGLYPVFLT